MIQKPFIILASLLIALSSCGESEKKRIEREANTLLNEARQEREAKRYENAREVINELRENYPTAFEARKAAILALDSIELFEAQDSVVVLAERVREEEELFAPYEAMQDTRGRNAEYFAQKNKLFYAREAHEAMEMKVKFFIKKIEEDKLKQGL